MTRAHPVLFPLLIATTGCAALLARGGDHRPPAQGGIYAGNECDRYHKEDMRPTVFQSYEGPPNDRRKIFSGKRESTMTPFEGTVFLTCMDSTDLDGAQAFDAITADHVDFDDRRFDHLRATAMVMDCALNESCSAASQRDVLGMMAGYARRIDPNAVDAALTSHGGSPGLREAVAAKLAWARATIEARVQELDPRRRHLWVDIPEQVWTERKDYFARFAKLYEQLDVLQPIVESGKGDLVAAIAKLRALRSTYLDSCKVEGCLFTPFVLDTTRALALAAVRQRDVPVAFAEAALLQDDRLATQLFSRAMLAALLPATKREYENWQKYNRTKDNADPATLQAMFGDTPPIQVTPDGPWVTWGRKELPNVTAAFTTDGLEHAGGNVRAVQRRGNDAVVMFADILTTYTDADCRETNKIDGIDSSGRIIYRQACTNYRTRTERNKIEPIEVPFHDAASLKPGDLVEAWVTADGRRGAVVDAEREGKIVQVRSHRLRVTEAARTRY